MNGIEMLLLINPVDIAPAELIAFSKKQTWSEKTIINRVSPNSFL